MSDGKNPDCLQQTGAPQTTDTTEQSNPTEETEPAKPVKSKAARSRLLPSFLRRVDLFLSPR